MKRIRKFFQSIYKKVVEAIFKVIYGKIFYNKKQILPNKKIIKKKSQDNLYFKNNNYFTHEIDNGIIYTDYVENVAVIKDKNLYKDTSFQQINGKLLTPNFNSVLKRGTPRIRKKIKGTTLSLVQGASSTNYFHWLFDFLPKIYICSKNYKISKIKR